MKNTYPLYYKKFRCIADRCPDTCCAGWGIVVDGESAEKYSVAKGAIGEKLRRSMTVDGDGDTVFICKNRRCPFLLESNLCEIYIELGKESLCKTCTLFPRFITDLGSRKETGISLSCPEAARLIFASSEPIEFETAEEDAPVQPNCIDPTLYFTLIGAQKTAINILQNRKFPIERRLIAFLRYCEAVQKNIRLGICDKTDVSDDFFTLVMASDSQAKRNLGAIFKLLESLEKLDPEWSETLDTARKTAFDCSPDFSDVFCENEWETEHLSVYFAFRYFMTAAFDGDLLSKAKFTVFSVIACILIEASHPDFSDRSRRIDAMRRYSKETEHSAENMDALFLKMKKSRHFGPDNLINILSSKYIPHKEK